MYWLNFVLPVVSIFIALSAFLVTLWPKIDDMFFEQRAVLVMDLISSEKDIMKFSVRNKGNDAGLLNSIRIEYELPVEGACRTFEVGFAGNRIVNQGDLSTEVSSVHEESLPVRSKWKPLTTQERQHLSYLRESQRENGSVAEKMDRYLELLFLASREYITTCNISVSADGNDTVILRDTQFYCEYTPINSSDFGSIK